MKEKGKRERERALKRKGEQVGGEIIRSRSKDKEAGEKKGREVGKDGIDKDGKRTGQEKKRERSGEGWN